MTEIHADYRFSHSIRVRWAEVDQQGVVFNPNYLLYVDVCITEYWRALAGGDIASLSSIFDNVYVVKSTVEYHSPAHFDDELTIRIRTAHVGRSSMQVLIAMYRGGEHLITAENIYVYAIDGKAQSIPAHFRALIDAFELTSDGG